MLFSAFSTRSLHLKNRIVFPPFMTNYGLRNEKARSFYIERAKGGVGLIFTYGIPAEIFSKRRWAKGLLPLIEGVKREGAKIGVQLWQGNNLGDEKVAPSKTDFAREIRKDEIKIIIEKFCEASLLAKELGFDVVEIHGAHGYFINQFFSPIFNKREDEYGGDLLGRMRFGVELVKSIRNAVGEDFPIFYRHSSEDGVFGGATIDDSIEFAKALKEAGLDVMDVSFGIDYKLAEMIPDASFPEATHTKRAKAIREGASIPTIGVGKIQKREVAEMVLREGHCDLVALGRQLLADPLWPKKVYEGREQDIVFCDYCNVCLKKMRDGEPLACKKWK